MMNRTNNLDIVGESRNWEMLLPYVEDEEEALAAKWWVMDESDGEDTGQRE